MEYNWWVSRLILFFITLFISYAFPFTTLLVVDVHLFQISWTKGVKRKEVCYIIRCTCTQIPQYLLWYFVYCSNMKLHIAKAYGMFFLNSRFSIVLMIAHMMLRCRDKRSIPLLSILVCYIYLPSCECYVPPIIPFIDMSWGDHEVFVLLQFKCTAPSSLSQTLLNYSFKLLIFFMSEPTISRWY